MICNTANPNKEKLRHANQWNIPAVLADWLWISVQTGDKKHFGPYLISPLQPAIHKGEKVSRVTNHSPDVPKEPEQDLGNSNTQQRQETQSKDEDNSLIDDALPNSIDLAPGFCASPIKENISAPLTLPPPAADNNEEKPSTSSNSLDQAISDLLKKNRSRSKPIGATEKGPSNAGPQRRRKLFGRANSNASMLGTKEPTKFGLSRASSIDTLNEDGYGSVVDGLTSPSVRGPSKAPSLASFPAPAALLTEKSDHTEAQQLLERRLNLLRNQSTNEFAAEEFEFGDEATPPMTQLGYEDPDAIAMREKIAGSVRNIKVAEKSDVEENNRDKKKSGVNLVVEPLQDNEKLAGWGGGRRTRSKRASAGKEL